VLHANNKYIEENLTTASVASGYIWKELRKPTLHLSGKIATSLICFGS